MVLLGASLSKPSKAFLRNRSQHNAHLIASGTDLKAIATRLGHASASFTLDRYGHLLPGQQAEAAARVAAKVDDYGRIQHDPGRPRDR